MEQEKILLQIESELVTLKTFVSKLKPEAKIHQLDIDLLRQKARSMYDAIMMLESSVKATPKATVADIKKTETVLVEEEHDDSLTTEVRQVEKKESVKKAEELMTVAEDDIKEYLRQEPPPAPAVKPASTSEQKEKEQLIVFEEKPKSEKPDSPPTVDPQPNLFQETLADKLASSDKQTVADKLSKNNLKSLRQYIGINEKFLFINELFNGDLSRYNHAIDELDSMPTLKGADTYLFELKVQNMWDDEMDAYFKLKELVQMKFS